MDANDKREASTPIVEPDETEAPPDSRVADTDDIDAAWIESEEAPTARREALARRPRDMMPTLHDEDPLQYDVDEQPAERAREPMVTLPEIDPLKYDRDPDAHE